MIPQHDTEARTVLHHFGASNQINKAVEELGELSDELQGTINRTKVIDEMADVIFMLEQMKILLDISDEELIKVKETKITRTFDRIEAGYYNAD